MQYFISLRKSKQCINIMHFIEKQKYHIVFPCLLKIQDTGCSVMDVRRVAGRQREPPKKLRKEFRGTRLYK